LFLAFSELREHIAHEWVRQGKGAEASVSKDGRTITITDGTFVDRWVWDNMKQIWQFMEGKY
jgi:hypothetical protein